MVTVYIMPLRTWLTGSFMTTWGQGRESRGSPGPRRSPEQARQYLESLRNQLEPLLAKRARLRGRMDLEDGEHLGNVARDVSRVDEPDPEVDVHRQVEGLVEPTDAVERLA